MITVAIVEDDQTLRMGLETLVNGAKGLRCVCACPTAAEAIRRIPEANPKVVLMDLQLPDKSGIECTALIKEKLPSAQIVVLTVYEDSNRIFQALQAGACGYLLKRSTPERILGAIREAEEGGVPMTPEIARKVIRQFQNQAASAAQVETLSAREKEVLQLVVSGLGNKAIADRLGVTVAAVKWHLQHIYDKLHVHSRTEAVIKFRSGG